MNLKNLSQQEKSLLLAGFFIVSLISVSIFLGYNFIQIDQTGVKCMDSPLVYAETRMYEDHGKEYDCTCNDAELSNKLNYNFTIIK